MADPKQRKTTKKGEPAKASVPVRRVEAEPVERQAWPLGHAGPFALMRRMEEDMARLWGDFFGGRGIPTLWGARAFGPKVDVYETDDAVGVKAELPGVDPKDVEINATEDAITLTGETRREEEIEEEGYHRSERSFGRFHRQIDLPAAVKADQAKATFKNGVLEITLPKAEAAKPRTVKVPIKSG
jgi:HSP20 family protein